MLVASAQALDGQTVLIGNPGNQPDTRYKASGIGAVPNAFRMGATEVTNSQYVEFLNAVAKSDPYGLYNPLMNPMSQGGIVRSGLSGNFIYAVKAPALSGTYTYQQKPVAFVNWYSAIRFTNWLHNGQGGPATTENGAYTLSSGIPNDVTRNSGASWWLPNEDEWYKAAYYDGNAGTYYDYPTGADSVPNNNPPTNDTGNSANFSLGPPTAANLTTGNTSYSMTDAGAYTLSRSSYGTFDQAGNVEEWNETRFSIPPGLIPFRGIRGGA